MIDNGAQREYADRIEQQRKIEEACQPIGYRKRPTAAQHIKGFAIMYMVGRGLRNVIGGGR
jgi:hypothetical protein